MNIRTPVNGYFCICWISGHRKEIRTPIVLFKILVCVFHMPFSITWNIFFILHYSSIQGATKIKVNSENLPYLLNANLFYTWYIWNSSHFNACRKRRLITNASFLYYQKFYISNIHKFPRIFIDVLSHNVFSYATKHLFKVKKRDNATTLCKLANCKAFHIKTAQFSEKF